jgi:hypothetical protein
MSLMFLLKGNYRDMIHFFSELKLFHAFSKDHLEH